MTEMLAKGMKYIDDYPEVQIKAALTANGTGTSTSNPAVITAAQESQIESAVSAHLAATANDPSIVGYWVLDDYPYGSILPTLQAIHTLIAQANATAVFPRPAVCGFGGNLDWKVSSTQTTWYYDDTYFKWSLQNYAPNACDVVDLYPYGSSTWNSSSAVDWSMSRVLPAWKQLLAAKGWTSASPIIAAPQTFYYGWDPTRTTAQWVEPNASTIQTQTSAYCQAGAQAIIPYAWNDGKGGTAAEELYNMPTWQTGLTNGLATCKTVW
jgi:hypothetical protein